MEIRKRKGLKVEAPNLAASRFLSPCFVCLALTSVLLYIPALSVCLALCPCPFRQQDYSEWKPVLLTRIDIELTYITISLHARREAVIRPFPTSLPIALSSSKRQKLSGPRYPLQRLFSFARIVKAMSSLSYLQTLHFHYSAR